MGVSKSKIGSLFFISNNSNTKVKVIESKIGCLFFSFQTIDNSNTKVKVIKTNKYPTHIS